MIYLSVKLYRIKQRIEEWESLYNCNRQYEVKLSRLCIGQTRLPHEYLFDNKRTTIHMPILTQSPIDNRTLSIGMSEVDCRRTKPEST